MWSDTKWYGSDMCKVFLVLNVTPETTHANFRLKIFVPFILEARVCGNCAKKNNMKANKLCKSGLVVGERLPKKNCFFVYDSAQSIDCMSCQVKFIVAAAVVCAQFIFFWAICLFIFFWVEGKSICDRYRWSFFFEIFFFI